MLKQQNVNEFKDVRKSITQLGKAIWKTKGKHVYGQMERFTW
jgi:hypothetical protein